MASMATLKIPLSIKTSAKEEGVTDRISVASWGTEFVKIHLSGHHQTKYAVRRQTSASGKEKICKQSLQEGSAKNMTTIGKSWVQVESSNSAGFVRQNGQREIVLKRYLD